MVSTIKYRGSGFNFPIIQFYDWMVDKGISYHNGSFWIPRFEDSPYVGTVYGTISEIFGCRHVVLSKFKWYFYCFLPPGYGSIPINTIFSGMNIHLPAILGFTRYQGFDPSPPEFRVQTWASRPWFDEKKLALGSLGEIRNMP